MSVLSLSCSLCVPGEETVIWQDEFCRLIAVGDDSYPVFCRIVTQEHWPEFSDLSSLDRVRVMNVVCVVEKTLRTLLNPIKVNIASFGNVVPHLHWHIIPRFEGDPHYPNPIWGESAGGQPFHPEAGFWKIFSQAIKESLDSKV